MLFAGLWLYLQSGVKRRLGVIVFAVLMAAVQVINLFAPTPRSDRAFAVTALASYVVLATIAGLVERAARRGRQAAA